MPYLSDPAFRKRSDRGTWQVIFSEVDGARRERCFRSGFRTRGEALRWFTDFARQYAAGEVDAHGQPAAVPGAVPAMGAFSERFLAWSATTIRPNSHAQERRIVARFLAFVEPGTQLDRVTTATLEGYLAERMDRDGVSPATANGELAILRKLFNVAVRWGLMERSPAAGVGRRRVPEKPVVHLEPAEARRLVEAARRTSENARNAATDAVYLFPMVVLALRCGLRRSELFRLRWRDIDTERRELWVRNSAAGNTKSGQERVVHLDDDALEAVAWWREWFGRESARLRSLMADPAAEWHARQYAPLRLDTLDVCAPRPERFVFASQAAAAVTGQHRMLDNVANGFRALAESVFPGRGLTLHHLRHTFAVTAARAGVPLPLLSQLMGHADMKTTSIYLRFAPSAGARAAMAMIPRL